MLLEEIIKWNDEDNFDRVIAAELAIALARHLDPVIGKTSDTQDPRFKSYFKKPSNTSRIFGPTGSVYERRPKNKLFT